MGPRLLHDDIYRRLCIARDFLHAHHAEPITLAEAARQAYLSRWTNAASNVVRGLVHSGVLGGGVLETADCRKTYQELRALGVEFLQPPTERPYGIEALIKDDSGNWFSMVQRTN